jgi:hypothetical protein
MAESVSYNRDVLPILANNCFACHGPDENTRKASLRLDLVEGALAPRKSQPGVLVPGDPETSALIQRILTDDPDDLMPPPDTGKSLTETEKATLRQWVEEGGQYEKHWAFEPVAKPTTPAIESVVWARNPIDAFIAARLERDGLAPSPEADKTTLLRRVYFDLIGLPPTPEQVSAFLNDQGHDAYERVVDQLLASPHFGERWGRHWLDTARYADSSGYSIDGPRSIWPYRDWVINAINANMPFDQFVIEQLAGDLLPDATRDQRVATGFHRNTMINQEGGVDKEEFRLEAVFDRVNTTGTVFLGLTMGCARCHSHKYDPISQREYFELLAFFNNDSEPTLPLPTPDQAEAQRVVDEKVHLLQEELKAYLEAEKDGAVAEWERSLTLAEVRELPAKTHPAFYTQPAGRTPEQRALIVEQFQRFDPETKRIDEEIGAIREAGPDIPTTMVLAAAPEQRQSHVFIQGDFTRKGDPVSPGTPAILPAGEPDAFTRLDLAQWLVRSDNPLTARVTVNRFWQQLFGMGLVETENDFGTQGTRPTHPKLLDWLATNFVESGWDVKDLLRTVCTSATYRQASHAREDVASQDPSNLLLARQNRLRLDAEVIRDNSLAVAGMLDPTVGGPGVYPPLPDGVMNLGQRDRPWDVSPGGDKYRRGMYTFFWRATPHPSLMVFDAPNAQFACTRRVRSNTPLQSLTLLNDEAFYECAQALAGRILEQPGDDSVRLERLVELSLSRRAEADELVLLGESLAAHRALYVEQPDAAAVIATEDAVSPTEAAAWTMLARTVLNLDEFITRE